ncbi:MAG: LysR family transcriptional regulator [Lachnospiraceae bacterium]
MEIRQLEYFREIATTGSINEAAAAANMSQPPLSYQMEAAGGGAQRHHLFERTRTGGDADRSRKASV